MVWKASVSIYQISLGTQLLWRFLQDGKVVFINLYQETEAKAEIQ